MLFAKRNFRYVTKMELRRARLEKQSNPSVLRQIDNALSKENPSVGVIRVIICIPVSADDFNDISLALDSALYCLHF